MNFRYRLYLAFSAILTLALGGVMAYAMHTGLHKLPLQENFSSQYANAIWDWTNPMARSRSDLEEAADLMKTRQINTVYADISVYNDIMSIEDGARREAELTRLKNGIAQYISIMNERGVRVFASAGDTDWSKPGQRKIPLAIQRFVHDYNQSTGGGVFAGTEFDIESYNQDGFEKASLTEKGLVLMEFIDTVNELAAKHEEYIKKSGNGDFEIGFAIPYWLDNQNGNIESVAWQDKTGPALYHLLDRLSQLPKSNVVVMAYRDAAAGNDGMIYHSRTEIDYAQAQAANVDIIIGIEVTNVEPEKITFYGKTHTELTNEVKLLYEEFEKSGVLGGTAINDLEGYRQFSR